MPKGSSAVADCGGAKPSRQPSLPVLARIIHESSAAVAPSSVLTALRFLALLGVLHGVRLRGAGVARLFSPALAPLRDEDL